MPFVITQSCCSDAGCVSVCPVNCIHPTPEERGFGSSDILHIDPEACIDCGSCTGVCFSGALSMDRVSWELVVDSERCTACGLCVPSCPMACFSLDFG